MCCTCSRVLATHKGFVTANVAAPTSNISGEQSYFMWYAIHSRISLTPVILFDYPDYPEHNHGNDTLVTTTTTIFSSRFIDQTEPVKNRQHQQSGQQQQHCQVTIWE